MYLQPKEVSHALSTIVNTLELVTNNIFCYNYNNKAKVYTNYYKFVSSLHIYVNVNLHYLEPCDKFIKVDINHCYNSTLIIINSILDVNYKLYILLFIFYCNIPDAPFLTEK